MTRYYKLGLSGDSLDSVAKMAENLFAGGSVDGDTALCEAALSVRCFMNLCELGVAFPVNRYGEYVGYKTDHDPFERATSAGPLTSKFMTQALQTHAEQLGVEVLDGYFALEILTRQNAVCGLLCLEKQTGALTAIRCGDIVMCTGGPAGIYADSAYPECHTGTTSLALLAGAKAQNLTEWQYGLASVKPRWNVSGTYMQVLPRLVSIDAQGTEHEFLAEYFHNPYEALSMLFLKGYQWPFDSKKVLHGSSIVDLLVYRECVLRGRSVYLDFTKNPFGMQEIEFDRLSDEAYTYLPKASATFGTPIDRLMQMNEPAVKLYLDKDVDLTREYLQIALCAQHSNGGIAVDLWWQTSVRGLFAAGECAGTHGVTRPGGSALNAGQVGSLRAAQFISKKANPTLPEAEFEQLAEQTAAQYAAEIDRVLQNPDTIRTDLHAAQRRMSDRAAAIRSREQMEQALHDCRTQLQQLSEKTGVGTRKTVSQYYKLRDILVTQMAVLTAMIDFAETAGCTRGSAHYYDKTGVLRDGLEEQFRFREEMGDTRSRVQEVLYRNGVFTAAWREVRPLPQNDDFFENVWATYRENQNIY